MNPLLPLLIAGNNPRQIQGRSTIHRPIRYAHPQLLGRSWLRSVGHAIAQKARPIAKPLAKSARKIGHVAATAGRAVGHAVASVGRMAEREAKRIIRRIARPLVAKALHGEEFFLFGDDSPSGAAAFLQSQKSGLISSITTAATGAVAASGIGAPAAPAVPFLLPPILDELINEVAKKGKEVLLGPDSNPDTSVPDTGMITTAPNATEPATGGSQESGGIMGMKVGGIPVIPAVAIAALGVFLLSRRKG